MNDDGAYILADLQIHANGNTNGTVRCAALRNLLATLLVQKL